MADSHPIENWHPVVGYEGLYEVSDLGRVRNSTKVLKPVPDLKGYPSVTISRMNRSQRLGIHKMVLDAFVGDRPGLIRRHLNGIRSDNRLANLAWGTYQENAEDSRRLGTMPVGEKNHASKLTDDAVREIRALYAAGHSCRHIATLFDVVPETVSRVIKRKRWAHVV